MKRPSKALTVALWCALVAAHATWSVLRVTLNPDPFETYANAWDFQLLMFAIFALPGWLLGLLAALLLRQRLKARDGGA